MKSSEILREAARWACATKRARFGGCHAISYAAFSDWRYWHRVESQPCFKYYELFKPADYAPFWFSRDKNGQKERTLALYFAAAIAESEGD